MQTAATRGCPLNGTSAQTRREKSGDELMSWEWWLAVTTGLVLFGVLIDVLRDIRNAMYAANIQGARRHDEMMAHMRSRDRPYVGKLKGD